jgi:putative nucleotidyltransferase with HDIG domain
MLARSLPAVRRSGLLLATLLGPLSVLLTLRHEPQMDMQHQSLSFHLVIVSAMAGCAFFVALAAGVAAVRVRRPGVVLLAAGCLICGAFMLVHGLVTPGVGHRPMNAWVARAPVLAILGFALCQGAATLTPTNRIGRTLSRNPIPFLGIVSTAVVTVAVIVVSQPTMIFGARFLPHEAGLSHVASVISAGVLLPSAYVHWRRYRLGRDSMQAVLMVAATLSIAAIMSVEFGKLWHISWWDYHVYLLVAFGLATYTIFKQYARARSIDAVLASAFADDPLEHIAQNYPDALRSLVRAVELKDSYTHGHSRRTAEIATALGVRLRLRPEELRDLAQGAYLHDVGKIAIPEEILNKPGRLTPEEREVIETHAALGAEMVREAPTLHACVDVVRHHHERFDGSGYPVGVQGTDIPLLARIAAVADVWDALTSDRSYRKGWEPEAALAHIVDGRGRHFDPDVVDAMVALAGEWGYRVRTAGDAEEAWAATQNCHETLESRVPAMMR